MVNANQTDGSVALCCVAKKAVISTVIGPAGSTPTKSNIAHVNIFTRGQR